MSQYFTHLASNNLSKNALQTAALEILRDQSNRLIDDAFAFLLHLTKKIEELNASYPRCTALRPSVGHYGQNIHFYLGEVCPVNFTLHPVKED